MYCSTALSDFSQQASFGDEAEKRVLDAAKFDWTSNDLSKKFMGCRTEAKFLEIFQEITKDQDGTNVGEGCPPVSKRPRIMQLASEVAREKETAISETLEEYSDTAWDKSIASYFEGRYVVYIA